MNPPYNFSQLSLKDLIEARDLFHVHLMNKKNVVATAIGRYLIRKKDFDAHGVFKSSGDKSARTLQNSVVANISWPCILVFVNQWEEEKDLIGGNSSDIVPKTIYMPDGRTVPICVVLAETQVQSEAEVVDLDQLSFPKNLIGGGFPVYVKSQGETHIASVGCVVSDGHTYYALTNKHVSGDEGELIYSLFGQTETLIGKSSGKSLSKVNFTKLYPGWQGANLLVCCDAGLIRIDNVNQWKTDILGIDHMDELFDLNTFNFSLGLIAEHECKDNQSLPAENGNVVAYGAVSGMMAGEIAALFYRYKSTGGMEYVSDFLIAGRNGKSLNNHHGNSGTVFLLETKSDDGGTLYQPIALHWGQHEFYSGSDREAYNFSLSTCLSNICRELDVELVRGWNTDTDYSWGKTGHFKIAALACDIVTAPKLRQLLQANKNNISFQDDAMLKGDMKNAKWGQFVPLADVPDIIWRMTRKADEANHFADMDESDPRVMQGKSLMQLCQESPNNVEIAVWNQYYQGMEAIDSTKSSEKRGALPFRVWQAYKLMVAALLAGNVEEFILVGGTASHYLGDACQPLHVSFLHHGHPDKPAESKVHSVYETNMLDGHMKELFDGVNRKFSGAPQVFNRYQGGKAAAEATITLMGNVISNILTPQEIIDVFNEKAKSRIGNMWTKLGDRTIDCVAAGTINLALFWESAWAEGKGDDNIPVSKLGTIKPDTLVSLYNDKTKYESYKLKDPAYQAAL
ncbi:MAG TPA: hypothetical protein VGN20_11850 [Mucilaginibacter sp.]|jgi:hypothetical protein